MKKIFQLEAIVGEDAYDQALGLLTLEVPFGWEEESLPTGESRFRVHCENADFIRNLCNVFEVRLPGARCAVQSLEEQDWVAAWKQFFTPVPCGRRFVVLPPWLADSEEFSDRVKVFIEPKSAFGTGHHATTALCLMVLSDLLDAGRLSPGETFLDLGTGSGVLGIACCKSGLRGEGLDIDSLAVENALENRTLNEVEEFAVGQGSIDAVPGKTYDLVLANILARPLIELAPLIVQACKPGACLVLSGLLEIQADSVEAAYTAQCLPRPRRVLDGEWCALVWD
ncbi:MULTISPECIES: 50S ribosomal protein L11 methyltransferase [Desulfovibrio]|uniref:Ribosomal protein L11 methyltransferase n=2 Tax=Desulfovibrio TaxID=872 RepID=A0AA94HTP8_DESDE|nr:MULTISPECIES: 50S ribosomal protein L11 methyltransferase [Desulfovibrio]ATD81277.1 50S ribosomal protein L11 methyltransferase [Desulfovibrio sp. G11]SFW58415.1 ribosomal protein L11 methyltransferase [Desulfovibrio desulfuricans]SPD36910.1 Ribosomal protein L11 methyltransferase [Desulfovibrio sp. G11]